MDIYVLSHFRRPIRNKDKMVGGPRKTCRHFELDFKLLNLRSFLGCRFVSSKIKSMSVKIAK